VFVAEMPLRCGSVRLTQTSPRYLHFTEAHAGDSNRV
jgi:hypothetical protein